MKKIISVALALLTLSACSVFSFADEEGETYESEIPQSSETLPALPSASPIQCPKMHQEPVTDLEVYQAPDMKEPPARSPFIDPVFHTCVVRVTDRRNDLSADDASKGIKNEYSRVQSFNLDGSRLIARGIEATWYLYDTETLRVIGQLPLEVEPRWSADDPDLVYYFSEAVLMVYNIRTGEQRLVHDFKEDLVGYELEMVWTRYEGSPSFDTHTWGLLVNDSDWLVSAFLVYDLPSDRVTALRDLRDWPDEAREIDSVTISPLGNYFLAYLDKYCKHGELGSDADPCGLMVYDCDLQNGRGLLRIVGHSDLALDAEEKEVFVYQDIDTDYISMLDLESGTITRLWPIDFRYTPIGLHISGRSSRKPGWVLVSTHDGDTAAHTWMDDQVFALELKSGGRMVRLANTHSLVDENQEHDYWAEPHASVDQDFTRALFTSNWGRSGSEKVEMYMVYLPAGWLD